MSHYEDMIKELEKDFYTATSIFVGSAITISALYLGLLFSSLSSIGF